ncbi:hypothetical protein MHU86_6681 [Fragilaria crotonensis]|nr:hypothetical protein MHU86_6681 [Fragilaria crotonensis]
MASNSANGYISNMLQSSNFVEHLPPNPKTVSLHKSRSTSGSYYRGSLTATMSAVSSSFSNDKFGDTSKCLEKKQIVVKNLLHAAVCSSNLTLGDTCSSSRTCSAVRTLYYHVRRCVASKCPVPRCANYRSAYHHMRQCVVDDCVLCEPARLSSEYVHFQPRVVPDDGGSPPSLLSEQSPPPSPPRLCLGTPRRYMISEISMKQESESWDCDDSREVHQRM